MLGGHFEVGVAGERLYFVFVDFENIDVLKCFELVFPSTRVNLFAIYISQETLSVDRENAVTFKRLHHLDRKIVGKKAAKVNVASIHIFKALYREWVGFSQYALGAIVHIGFVFVFEIHCFATRNHIYIHAHSAKLIDCAHFRLSKRGHQFVANRWQFAYSMRYII